MESKTDGINNINEKKELNHIWDEVTETTEGIFIHYCNSKKNDTVFKLFSQPHPNRVFRRPASEEEFRERFPNFIMINPYDYKPDSIDSLKGMPQNLPNLSILSIKSHEFRSLKGLPAKLPNLKNLSIEGFPMVYLIKDSDERKWASKKGAPLSDLNGLPKSLPNLEVLSIHNSQIADINNLPEKLPSLRIIGIKNCPLKSLKGLPNNFPSLETFVIYNCPIQTLDLIPPSLPKLIRFELITCNFQNLRIFPKNVPNLKKLSLGGNQLTSLEGLPQELPNLKKLDISGNSLISLKSLPKFDKPINLVLTHNPLRSLCYLKHEFTLQQIYLHEFKRTGFNLNPRFIQLLKDYVVPIEETIENPGVIGYYDSNVLMKIKKYYEKTTIELVEQFISKPDSINEDELDRIIWEADLEDRKILESYLPKDNPILQKINQRLSVNLSSGLKIYN